MDKGLVSVDATSTIDGVVNVSKPVGWTSHDVVEKLRRSLGIRKIGHGGTLDPMATGVLPLLIGRGTRLSEYLVEWHKEYEGVFRLGQETDTEDATGEVIQEQSVEGLTGEAIQATAEKFSGVLQQVPPMYSALKHEGLPLYKIARSGKTVERASRSITIYELEILNIDLPDVAFRATCSKGTYIRTLCADIGRALGVGGHLRQLCRTRVGPFYIKDAVSPLEVDFDFLVHRNSSCLWGLDAVLGHFPEIVIDSSMVTRALNGAPIPETALGKLLDDIAEENMERKAFRVKSPDGQLLGLGKFSQAARALVFVKVFGFLNN